MFDPLGEMIGEAADHLDAASSALYGAADIRARCPHGLDESYWDDYTARRRKAVVKAEELTDEAFRLLAATETAEDVEKFMSYSDLFPRRSLRKNRRR